MRAMRSEATLLFAPSEEGIEPCWAEAAPSGRIAAKAQARSTRLMRPDVTGKGLWLDALGATVAALRLDRGISRVISETVGW